MGLSLLPEIPIRPQQPSLHVRDDIFPLLGANRLGPHLRVFVVLIVEHHRRDQAAALLFVADKLSPALGPHAHAPHEPVRPVIIVRHAVLVLQQKRHMDLALEQRPGDGVPVRIISPKISFASSRLPN